MKLVIASLLVVVLAYEASNTPTEVKARQPEVKEKKQEPLPVVSIYYSQKEWAAEFKRIDNNFEAAMAMIDKWIKDGDTIDIIRLKSMGLFAGIDCSILGLLERTQENNQEALSTALGLVEKLAHIRFMIEQAHIDSQLPKRDKKICMK